MSGTESDSQGERDFSTGETARERTGLSGLYFSFLLTANRWLVAGGLALGVFLTFMAWGVLKPVPLHATMEASDMVETTFAGFIGAIITGTTLVVSINQLVLSQEIGSLGSQRDRMNASMDFRESTDDLLGRTSPADPTTYLRALIETNEERASAFRDALSGAENEALRAGVDAYVDDLIENAESALADLEGGEFGTFDVVPAALDYDHDRKMHDLRRIRRAREADLTDEQRAAFGDLLTALTMYGPVREYVKDLYIQWALVKLSRAILYAAIFALTVAGGMVVFVDPTTFAGAFLGIESVLWVVSAAFAVSALPFLLFTAYILRLATLAKQTLAMGPLQLS